jgi:hypothetical protein
MTFDTLRKFLRAYYWRIACVDWKIARVILFKTAVSRPKLLRAF